MNWLDRLLGKNETSGQVAKQRLQMVLIHDRADLPPGMLELIKDDIIQVIARHMAIDTDKVVVHLEQDTQENRLVAEIPLLAGRTRRNGASSR
ncbi:MAG TPA: cell division topological specificity factor MinE [Promineifilum sp.]|nr:cell division topological specificity factor MinE [Promineifilum sp.]HRO23316.1 cell division topological specificity factor MinE [Promineifilum sp.]HRO90688.1 cell division topological specificity factor MinE [Promineifilum sp.]HRQ13186.1 cell division topological specificity factor MinE [Promineifilum sp.]